jgi:chitin synthase
MPAHRKPVPRAVHTPDIAGNSEGQSRGAQRAAMPRHSPVDPQLTRYTLTDGPAGPSQHQTQAVTTTAEPYDEISNAVNQLLQNRHSVVTDPRVGQDALSARDDDRSVSKHSSVSSAVTFVDHEGYAYEKDGKYQKVNNGEEYEAGDVHYGPDQGYHEQGQPPASDLHSSADYVPYQPGQLLPTIVTGESLNWDDYNYSSQPDSAQDPFLESGAPPMSAQPDYVYIQPEYAQSHSRPPSRAGTAHSYHPSFGMPPDPNPSFQQHDVPAQNPVAGPYLDHFQHDTEAYASGNYSRASFHQPRSRSATPIGDDDDYHIVDPAGVHYPGYPPQPDSVYDPEKQQLDHDGNFVPMYPHEQGFSQEFGNEKDITTLGHLNETDGLVEETRHFGPAPTGRAIRRHKTKKRVQLTNGNLVVDIDVPDSLVLPRRGAPEMMKTRYTAVTCDPDEFEAKGFFLRQNETGRKTELFIVITMYNVRSQQRSLHAFS